MISLFTILALTTSAALADPGALAESEFARSRFRPSRPTTVKIMVQTCNSKGKVKAVQVRASGGTLRLNSLDLFYVNGGKQSVTGFRLEEGQMSPWIPLSDQVNPCLNKVHLNVAGSNSKVYTEVLLFGQWEQ